jgi:CheY-like chemotaxis protein
MVPRFPSRPQRLAANGVGVSANAQKVLVVIPDLAVAIILQKKLEQGGFTVEVVGNPRLALRIIEMDPVHLVVVDFGPSGFDVHEFVRAIRSYPESKTLPVLVRSNPHLIPALRKGGESDSTHWTAVCDCTPGRLLRIVGEMLGVEPAEAHISGGAGRVDNQCASEPEEHAVNIFMASAPYTIARLWTAHRAFLASRHDPVRRLAELSDAHRQAGILGRAAGLADYREIAKLACALEAHLIDLQADPGKLTGPVEKMLAPAVDVLALFVDRAVTAVPKQTKQLFPPAAA